MAGIRLLTHSWSLIDGFLFAGALVGAVFAARPRAPLPAVDVTRPTSSMRSADPTARSDDPLGGLVGTQVEEAYGVGGLGLVGNGRGNGEGVIGLGSLYRQPMHVCVSRDFDDDCVDFTVLKRAVRHQQREARACLARARHDHPRLRAQVEIDFDVEADGSVGRDRLSGSAPPRADSLVPDGDDDQSPELKALEDCLSRAVSHWRVEPEWLRSSSLSYWFHLGY